MSMFGFLDHGHIDLTLSKEVANFGDDCEKKVSVPLKNLWMTDGMCWDWASYDCSLVFS